MRFASCSTRDGQDRYANIITSETGLLTVQRACRTKELVMALRRRYAEAVQMPFDLRHKRLGAEEVGIQIALLGQPLSQLFQAEKPLSIARIAFTRFAVTHVMAQLRTLSTLRIDPVTEGMHPGVTRAVNKVNIAARVARRFQHAQRRSDTDASGDQHQRLGRLAQDENPCRREQLQAVANLQL